MIIVPFRRIIPSAGPLITPGSVAFTTPGTYYFTVPNFRTLTADVRGPGGGGGACYVNAYPSGSAGGPSYFDAPTGTVIAYSGGGGVGLNIGASGGGQVVASVTAGGVGLCITDLLAYARFHMGDGTAANGDVNTTGGGSPGGACGFYTINGAYHGGYGGYGGRAVKTWVRGLLVPNTTIIIVVGAGGVRGIGDNWSTAASNGLNGSVNISWS